VIGYYWTHSALAFKTKICNQTWKVQSDLAREINYGSQGPPIVEGASGYHRTHSDIEFWV